MGRGEGSEQALEASDLMYGRRRYTARGSSMHLPEALRADEAELEQRCQAEPELRGRLLAEARRVFARLDDRQKREQILNLAARLIRPQLADRQRELDQQRAPRLTDLLSSIGHPELAGTEALAWLALHAEFPPEAGARYQHDRLDIADPACFARYLDHDEIRHGLPPLTDLAGQTAHDLLFADREHPIEEIYRDAEQIVVTRQKAREDYWREQVQSRIGSWVQPYQVASRECAHHLEALGEHPPAIRDGASLDEIGARFSALAPLLSELRKIGYSASLAEGMLAKDVVFSAPLETHSQYRLLKRDLAKIEALETKEPHRIWPFKNKQGVDDLDERTIWPPARDQPVAQLGKDGPEAAAENFVEHLTAALGGTRRERRRELKRAAEWIGALCEALEHVDERENMLQGTSALGFFKAWSQAAPGN